MAGIASMLKDSGFAVQGSDSNAYPPMSVLLDDKGIKVMQGYAESHLASRPDLVVVGNVARKDNPEVQEALRLNIPLLSMPQVIRKYFLDNRTSVTVAGTHGKTTVTSILAWLFEYAEMKPGYLVGGVPLNFGSNYLISDGDLFVIEGDEYDTAFFDKKAKFFHYNPTYAALTSLEFDHADIYPDFAAIKSTFKEFAALVNPDGAVAWCADYKALTEVVEHCRCRTISYGFAGRAQLRIEGFDTGPSGTKYTIVDRGGESYRVSLRQWGRHNVLNATAAFAVAREAGISVPVILEGLATFKGVMRRFQVVGSAGGVTIIDDFAHHPTAVKETIAAARARFPESRLFAVYHFNSNTSRRKIFEQEYSGAFLGADHVCLTYPQVKADNMSAAEYLDPQVVAMGIERYAQSANAYGDFSEMAAAMAEKLQPSDVVLAMSGRDLTPLYDDLLARLRAKAGDATGADASSLPGA
jgi:UDP-N-acetylmuramate: L-alanyl-gamma-D-glutamyl-meso-diaminopimelate ligase